jgi:hypothetical protein
MDQRDANPHVAPRAAASASDAPRPLTPRQRQFLRTYLAFHDQPPTLSSMLGKTWKSYLILLLWTGAMAYLCVIWNADRAAFLVVGMALGSILNGVGIVRRFLKVWPVLDSVFDWDRVRQRLEE